MGLLSLTKCKNCGNEVQYEIQHYVDAVSDPKAVERIINNSFFSIPCDCFPIPEYHEFPVIYCDRAKHFIVSLLTEPMDQLFLAKYLYRAYNANGGSRDNYRITNDKDTFREKVIISRYGYDDRIIEIMKYLLYRQTKAVITDLNYLGAEFYTKCGEGYLRQKGDVDIVMEITLDLYEKFEKRFYDIVRKPEYNGFRVVDFKWAKQVLDENPFSL